MRLDKYLVEAGFVSSRTLAAKLIAAGDVQVNGKVARKASMLVGPEDTLYVRQSIHRRLYRRFASSRSRPRSRS